MGKTVMWVPADRWRWVTILVALSLRPPSVLLGSLLVPARGSVREGRGQAILGQLTPYFGPGLF